MLPVHAYVVGKTGTRVVEALYGQWRHRCGVLVRRFRSFSKCRTATSGESKSPLTQPNSEITLH